MHLQICWDVTPGKKFFYWSQGLGWLVSATFFTITNTITGVSFRFGDVCHVNAANSMADFWGPLLVIAGSAMLVQVSTLVQSSTCADALLIYTTVLRTASRSTFITCGATTRPRLKAVPASRLTRLVYEHALPVLSTDEFEKSSGFNGEASPSSSSSLWTSSFSQLSLFG